MSTPGVLMRIEAPCPNCTHQNKTQYGLVTPFANQLYYLNQSPENPPIQRKTIAEELGQQDPQGELPASVAEVINAYLMWLDMENPPSSECVGAPPGSVLYFLPASELRPNIKKVLQQKLQIILASQSPEKDLAKLAETDKDVAILNNIITSLAREHGFNLSFLISLIIIKFFS